MKNGLVSSAVCLSLLAACDKPVPAENVTPRSKREAGVDVPFEPLDASVPDAGLQSESPTIETTPRPFSKLRLLEEAAACARAHYSAFLKRAEELRDAVRTAGSTPTDENKEKARNAWRLANVVWQQAELFRFGPAALAMFDPGGRDLRDEIYAFPQINTCVIDQNLVAQNFAAGVGSTFASARGLGALEYLLFFTASGNSCSTENSINKSGSWAAIGAEDLAARRASYGAAVADDLLTRAQTLVAAWEPSGDNFTAALTAPTSSPYVNEQAALNAVTHGLFYLEKEIKDYKLGLPLGLVVGCSGICPQTVEARYAGVSIENIRLNLSAFRKLFQGCGAAGEGLGFDDALRAVGPDASTLADDMLKRLDDAERVAASVPGPLQQALVTNQAAVLALHAAVKALNDLLKVDMVSALNLELPMSAEGDND